MTKRLTREQVIELLRKRQGDRTAKELAEELEISQQYLSDVYSGKREIGRSILERLDLETQTVYVPATKEGLQAN